MISLDSIVEKIYGYKPSTLTPDGLSGLAVDVMQLSVCGFLFINYPKILSDDATIRWAGAVALLLLMIYGFFPPMVRVLYGRYYAHYVESEDAEIRGNTIGGDLDVSIAKDGTVLFGICAKDLHQTTVLTRDQAIAFSKNIISAIDEYEKDIAESSVARDLL
jgi:hypothetical protein